MSQLNYRPAGFGKRLLAIIIDAILLTVANKLISILLSFVVSNPSSDMMVNGVLKEGVDPMALFLNPVFIITSFIVPLLISFGYYGYFYSTRGATLGKAALNLKVIDSRDDSYIGYFRAFSREVVGKFISSLILMIGYLMVLFRADKKALHDVLFNTKVLEVVKDEDENESEQAPSVDDLPPPPTE